jgi:NTP pyrophosphatase (non-canonical NTP hydrolase)
MIDLPENPTIADLQKFVAARCKERGWTERTDIERLMFLTEEVGEVAKEIRKRGGKYGYKPGTDEKLGEELVDVLNFILDIANANGLDLEQAFRAKWHAVATRTWES